MVVTPPTDSTLVPGFLDEVVPLPGRADELPGRTVVVPLTPLPGVMVAPRSPRVVVVPPRRSL